MLFQQTHPCLYMHTIHKPCINFKSIITSFTGAKKMLFSAICAFKHQLTCKFKPCFSVFKTNDTVMSMAKFTLLQNCKLQLKVNLYLQHSHLSVLHYLYYLHLHQYKNSFLLYALKAELLFILGVELLFALGVETQIHLT
jgi:hypothetical protein